jgi:Arc/MetJ family transcription regulator
MSTSVEVDDELMATVLRETGLSSTQAAVEEGLRLLLQRSRARLLLDLGGKVPWEGDLDRLRGRLPREPEHGADG